MNVANSTDEQYNDFHAYVTKIINIFKGVRKQGLVSHQQGRRTVPDAETQVMVDELYGTWPENGFQTGSFILGDENHVHIGFIGARCDGQIPTDVVGYAAHQMALPVCELIQTAYPEPLATILAVAVHEALETMYSQRVAGRTDRDELLPPFAEVLDRALAALRDPIPFKPDFLHVLNEAAKVSISGYTGREWHDSMGDIELDDEGEGDYDGDQE